MYTWIWAWDYFSFTIALIAGALLVGYNMPRRNYFVIRALICFAVIIGFVFGWRAFLVYIADQRIGIWYTLLALARYVIQYFIIIFSIRICFECDFWAALFCGTAAYCLQHISQRVYAILEIAVLLSLPYAVNAIILTLITVVIYLLFYFLVIRKNKYSLSNIAVDNKIQILSAASVILVAIVFSSLIIVFIYKYASVSVFIYLHVISIASAFLALVLEFSAFFAKKRQKEIIELQHMLYEKSAQYEMEKTNIEQINIKTHDLKHQLMVLDDKIDKAELKEISEAIDIYNSFIKTGNDAIDTIITQKSLYCRKHNIRLTCLLNGSEFDFIPPHELYALFGNAIENAIEAVKNLDVEKRIVSIVESRRSGSVTVRIINYYDGELSFAEGLPITRKNKEYHGFGMKSMKLLAEKYGGCLQVQTRKDLFVLAVCLPSGIHVAENENAGYLPGKARRK